MSKLIKFAQQFPTTHPKAGLPTGFVEQILNGVGVDYTRLDYYFKLAELNIRAIENDKLKPIDLANFQRSLSMNQSGIKSHTIRNGNRFKVGDYFTPTVWSDIVNPKSGRKGAYHSPQIIFWDDLEIKHCQEIIMTHRNEVYINQKPYGLFASENFVTLAKNDGLSQKDMRDWFSKLPFEGQIICWDESVKY